MIALTPDRLRAAHAHAAVLVDRFGDVRPYLIDLFEHLNQAVADLERRDSVIEKARRIAAARRAA